MYEEEKYEQLEKELAPFMEMLGKVSETIIDKEVSSYPIIVISRHIVNIGIPLSEPTESVEKEKEWMFNASSLEEFATKNLIESNKVEAFKSVYKDYKKFLCMFVVERIGATFVFLPRK